jgi:CHASE3 domain sensor protein
MMSNIIGLVFVVIAGLFCFMGFVFFVLVISLESIYNSIRKIFIKDKPVRRKRGWKKI